MAIADYHVTLKFISEIRRVLKPEEFIVTNIKQGNRNQNIVSPPSKLLDFGEFGIAKVYSELVLRFKSNFTGLVHVHRKGMFLI